MAQTAKARARQRGRELAAAQAERRARIRAAYSPATVLSSDDHDIGSSSVDISPFVRSAPAPVEPSFSGPPLEPATPKKPKVDRSREGILAVYGNDPEWVILDGAVPNSGACYRCNRFDLLCAKPVKGRKADKCATCASDKCSFHPNPNKTSPAPSPVRLSDVRLITSFAQVGIETRGSPMEQRALRRVLSVLEDETE
ncbi:hypothetical protein Q5752_003626 [Cryptotrichosporon argae]